MRRNAYRWVVAASLLLTAPSGTALAQSRGLSRALELYEQGELAGALAVFERTLSEGGHDAATVRTIYVHLAVLRAGAGDGEGAIAAFRALLSLDPAAQPPEDVSPVIREPFDQARAARGDAPALAMRVDAPATHEVGDRHAAVVHATGDGERLVRSVRIEVLSGPARGRTLDPTGAPPRFEFPPDATSEAGDLVYRVDLLDAHGSTLASSERSVSVFARSEPPPPSFLSNPFFWGGAAAVVGGVILVAVLASGGSGQATVGAPQWETP